MCLALRGGLCRDFAGEVEEWIASGDCREADKGREDTGRDDKVKAFGIHRFLIACRDMFDERGTDAVRNREPVIRMSRPSRTRDEWQAGGFPYA